MNKSIILSAIFFITISLNLSASANEYIERNIDGYRAKMLKVTPNSGYKIVVSASNDWESLDSLIKKVWGVSWVNGAFFCPKDYAECGGKSFSNTMRIVNEDAKTYSIYYPDTWINGLFGFDINNAPILLKNSVWSWDESTNFNSDSISSIENWIANFPMYLHDGKNMLSLYSDSEIDAKMRTKSLKNFICSKEDGTILMGWVENITIYDIPNLLLKYSCKNAINLDTGWSTAMIYNSKYIRWPGRNIMDAFVIVPVSKNTVTSEKTPRKKLTKKSKL